MREDYKKLFSYLKSEEPPARLMADIFAEIERSRKIQLCHRFIFNIAASVVSFIALAPAIYFLITETMQSGFYEYLMLVFSDNEIIASYWQNFGLLLLESLPVLSLTLTFITFLGFFYFFKQTLTNLKFKIL